MTIRQLIRERLIGAACGAGGVIAMVLLLGWVGEQDYQDALRAQQQAKEARADAVAQRQAALAEQRTARHQRHLAESAQRLQEMRRGEWR